MSWTLGWLPFVCVETAPEVDDDAAFTLIVLLVELGWRLDHVQRLQPVDSSVEQLRVVADDARRQHAWRRLHTRVLGKRGSGGRAKRW